MTETQGSWDRDAASSNRWYYLGGDDSSPVGPVNAYQLAGLLDTTVITPETLVWTDGQKDWLSLQSTGELYNQVYNISASGNSAVPAGTMTPSSGLDGQQRDGVGLDQSNGAAGFDSAGALSASPAEHGDKGDSAKDADTALAEFGAAMLAMGEVVEGGLANKSEDYAAPQRGSSPEEKEFEDDDGTVYVWDASLRKFQPRQDTTNALEEEYGEEAMTYQPDDDDQPAFEMPQALKQEEEQNSDAEEVTPEELAKSKPAEPVLEEKGITSLQGQKKAGRPAKRKAEDVMEREAKKLQRAKEEEESRKKWFDLKVNTSVYVTGLPDDVTEQKLAERFSQYGVLKPGEGGAPKVKVYRHKDTQDPKGDGLVTFLYEPSVALACKLADDDFFAPGMGRKMTVKPAEFKMHGDEYVPKKKTRNNKNSKEKAKVAEKVLGWGGFDDSVKPSQVTVIIANMFHPDELLEDSSLLQDLESDIKAECSKLGKLDKVRIFAGNPQGIVSARFKTIAAAEKCIETMEGRFFGGRRLHAHMWDGHTNYNVKLQESEEQLAARRARFAQEIEAQEAHKPDTD